MNSPWYWARSGQLGLFSRTGLWQCPLSSSPEFGPGHLGPVPSPVQATLVGDASATDITEEAALARNAGSEPQLALSVFLGHSDDD